MKSDSPPTIRLLLADDVDDFRAIRLMALRDAPDAFGSTYADEAARPASRFAERLCASSIFGAYLDGTIVAMVGFARHAGPKERHKGFIWGMFVAPQARGQGVAGPLLEAVLDHASSHVELVTLRVVTTNTAAIALYTRHGFECCGVEPRSLKSHSGYADEMDMVRFL